MNIATSFKHVNAFWQKISLGYKCNKQIELNIIYINLQKSKIQKVKQP